MKAIKALITILSCAFNALAVLGLTLAICWRPHL